MAKGKVLRVELDHDGIEELMCSPGIDSALTDAARSVARRAGAGFEVKAPRRAHLGIGSRDTVAVYAGTYKAKVAEARDKALSKAVHS